MNIKITELNLGDTLLFKNINMSINQGDLIHIIGRNGVGKSTFFKVLLGKYRYNGTVDISPIDIAVISDYASIPKELFVYDIVMFLKTLHKETISNKNLYKITKISEILNRRVNDLSSGEKRRLEIYSTLFKEKKVVIFDEVTNGLDEETSKDILNLILQIKKEFKNIIIFYTSHDIREITYIGGRTFFINKNMKIIYEKHIENENELSNEYLGRNIYV